MAIMQLHNHLRLGTDELHSVIFLDSQEALLSLKSSGQQNWQAYIARMTKNAQDINRSIRASVRFQWCPRHSNISGNKIAHQLANKTTTKGELVKLSMTPIIILSIALREVKEKMWSSSKSKFYNDKTGRFIKCFDKALPVTHIRLLYNRRSKPQARI